MAVIQKMSFIFCKSNSDAFFPHFFFFYANKFLIFVVQGQTRLNPLIAAIGPMGFFRALELSQGPDGIMLWGIANPQYFNFVL